MAWVGLGLRSFVGFVEDIYDQHVFQPNIIWELANTLQYILPSIMYTWYMYAERSFTNHETS